MIEWNRNYVIYLIRGGKEKKVIISGINIKIGDLNLII